MKKKPTHIVHPETGKLIKVKKGSRRHRILLNPKSSVRQQRRLKLKT